MRTTHIVYIFTLILVFQGFSSPAPPPQPRPDWIEVIQKVGPEGRGNAAASRAWKHLADLPPAQIPDLLQAMDGANDLAVNWLEIAVHTIAEKARNRGHPLPLLALGEFLLDRQHHPHARSLAFELITEIAPTAAEQMLPGMLNDPSTDLRQAAVDQLLNHAEAQATATQTNASILLYHQALGFARDANQIRAIHGILKKMNQTVDLPRHFGFIMDWHVIGPFHNAKRKGFEEVFPPELKVDLSSHHPGKSGPVQWKQFTTTHDYGKVDLNKAYDYLKEVTAYAYTEFLSDTAQPAELRLGCKNAWKIWFNGSFLFGREEYHRGQKIDQYRMNISLKQGRNTILVKLCQNEQTEDWTREWEFQMRVCDATGTAILSTDRRPASSLDQR